MSPTVDQLLGQPESKTLEFKRDLSSPRNVLKTLVAFANAAGGHMVIGVDDAGQVLGLTDPAHEEERLCSLIADGIAPRLAPHVERLALGDQSLLLVEVLPSSAQPHYLVSQGPERGTYVRLGSSTRQAGPDWIAEMQRQSAGRVFDEQPMPGLTPEDLDIPAIERLLGPKRPVDAESLMTLKLICTEQGRQVPTQGAVLMFGKTRERHFPDAWVQCGRFRGQDKVDIFDQQDIHAHLPDAVDQIEQFLKKHAFKTARFGAMQREDIWSIPLTMLREAIVNAVVHSDYAQRGTPIRVAFFDDRIDIESPGLLMPGMTVDDMKNGVSRIRNPVIARMFRELDLIEQWGSDVKRIFSEAASLGLPEPAIAEIATGVQFRIFLAQAHQPGLQAHAVANNPEVTLSRLESRLESNLAAKLLLLLEQQDGGKASLAKSLGHKSVSGELHKQIRRLLDLGMVQMTLPDKPQSRLQRYQLTAKAHQLLISERSKP